jgi:hypothetical protein
LYIEKFWLMDSLPDEILLEIFKFCRKDALRSLFMTNWRFHYICHESQLLREIGRTRGNSLSMWLEQESEGGAFITLRGTLYVWGDDIDGRLGLFGRRRRSKLKPEFVPLRERVWSASIYKNAMAVISESGQVYMSGNGSHGKLADRQRRVRKFFYPVNSTYRSFQHERFKQVQVYKYGVNALSESGRLWKWNTADETPHTISFRNKAFLKYPIVKIMGDYRLLKDGNVYIDKKRVYQSKTGDPVVNIYSSNPPAQQRAALLTRNNKVIVVEGPSGDIIREYDLSKYRPLTLGLGKSIIAFITLDNLLYFASIFVDKIIKLEIPEKWNYHRVDIYNHTFVHRSKKNKQYEDQVFVTMRDERVFLLTKDENDCPKLSDFITKR